MLRIFHPRSALAGGHRRKMLARNNHSGRSTSNPSTVRPQACHHRSSADRMGFPHRGEIRLREASDPALHKAMRAQILDVAKNSPQKHLLNADALSWNHNLHRYRSAVSSALTTKQHFRLLQPHRRLRWTSRLEGDRKTYQKDSSLRLEMAQCLRRMICRRRVKHRLQHRLCPHPQLQSCLSHQPLWQSQSQSPCPCQSQLRELRLSSKIPASQLQLQHQRLLPLPMSRTKSLRQPRVDSLC